MYREGQLYTQQEGVAVFDHDWKSLAQGVAIPHGLYDLRLNIGYIHIGTSHDTSELACDSIRYWWQQYGQQQYTLANSILLLCDGGGSNSSRQYLFKQDLQALADDLGIEIRVAHYPPYTSKYNPIEHRLFPHVTRACQGVIFESVEMVKQLMAKAKTHTGLTVFTTVFDKIYQTGRQVTEEFKQTMPIRFDEYLPQWNYTAIPRGIIPEVI
ncbi:MAG TPA: ISAzo13 family transposase [Cyanophyceae cyanobacterium]